MIESIQRMLASRGDEEAGGGASMAAAYAMAVCDAKARVDRVEQLLAAGNQIDALMEMEREPDLLGQFQALALDEIDAWNDFCVQRGWQTADRLDAEAIQRIMRAREQGLQASALVGAYRAAARKKDLRQCIWLLRKLREAEPANKGYGTDLKEFELRRISQLRADLASALQSRNNHQIQHVAGELNAAGWTVPIPDDLRSSAERAVRDFEKSRALDEAVALLQELGAAYSAMNMDDGIRLVGRIEALVTEFGITLPEDYTIQFNEARAWCQEEERRRADTMAFTTKVEALRNAVEHSDAVSADELLNELARFESTVPENLADRAGVLVDNWRLERERVRRRVNLIVAISLIIACIAGVVYWRNTQMKQRATLVAGELNGYIENLDLAAYERRVTMIKAEEPGLLKRPELSSLINKAPELQQKIDEKRARFTTLLGQLDEALAADEITGDVDMMLSDLEALAHTGNEFGVVADRTAAWTKQKAAFLAAFQKAWDAWTIEADTLLTDLEKIPLSETEQRERQLQLVRDYLPGHPTFPNPEYEAMLVPYSRRLQQAEGRAEEAQNQWAKIEAAKSLSAYLDEIDIYTKAFPADPRAAAIGEVLDFRADYEALMHDPATAAPGNPFWGRMASRRSARSVAEAAAWPTLRDRIVEWEQDERLVEMYEYRPKGEAAGSRIAYIQGKPTTKDSLRSQVMIYRPRPGSNNRDPEFRMEDFGRALFSDVSKSDYCAEVHKVIGAVRFAEAKDGYWVLLEQTTSLLANDAIPPLLRAYLGVDLLEAIQELMPATSRAALDDSLTTLRTVKDSIHWLCVGHPQYKAAEKKAITAATRAVNDIGPLLAERDWTRIDRMAALRSPRLYAIASLDGSGFRKMGAGQPRELWVLRRQDNTVRIHILATVGADSKSTRLLSSRPGEPIFAPADDSTTAGTISSLRKQGVKVTHDLIVSDPAWPVNQPAVK